MPKSYHVRVVSTSLLVLMLAACGGGGDNTNASANASSGNANASTNNTGAAVIVAPAPVTITEPNAPRVSGNTATDGFNWINFRRQQIGVQSLIRNSVVDTAAQGHSDYQKINNTITHTQSFGKPGYTGAQLADRLMAAGFRFNSSAYAYGEVISSTGDTSGASAAEDLITAIYHRFVIFEPMFKEAGVGAATISGGYTYFTADLVSDNLDKGIGNGQMVTYPASFQQNVLRQFSSDQETPDPVPGKNIVGFPISVHADVNSVIKVQTFSLTPRCEIVATPGCGVALLPEQSMLLSADTDPRHTPASAAALIPLDVLAPQTTYDVRFIGSIDGTEVNRGWSFTTR